MRRSNHAFLTSFAISALVVWFGAGASADEKAREAKPCAPVAQAAAKVMAPNSIGVKSISTNVSPDKLSQTILFDSLTADYGPQQAAKAFAPVKTAFLEVPVTAAGDPQCELLGYTVDVRGHVDLTPGARASVVVVVAGEANVIDFPFEKQSNGDFNERFFILPKTMGTPEKAVVRGPVRIQLIVQVETATPQDAAALTVDSLNMEARRAN